MKSLTLPDLTITDEVEHFLAIDAPVAIGVSGGKDSCAVAFAVQDYLDSIHHRGPRILIHSHLGLVEWKDSLPTCRRLAKATGLELIVVERAAGGMMERWETRWANNVARYLDLSCVQLILPWSTPSMRFCTAELKRDVICRELVIRFPSNRIISVSGIRRDESNNRKKAPTTKEQPKLTSAKYATTGFDWHPLLAWTTADVFAYLEYKKFRKHEAYRVYGSSRVSCAFCIMSRPEDLAAAARCPDNHAIYRRMTRLEVDSAFSFQDRLWLSDVAPELLDEDVRGRLDEAKRIAAKRQEIEAQIPRDLLYVKGWPTRLPTTSEAAMLAAVRQSIGRLYDWKPKYTTAKAVRERYQELLDEKARKAG